MNSPTIGVQLIATERQKQIDKYGFTAEYHVKHPEFYENDQLKYASIKLLSVDFTDQKIIKQPENWDQKWFKNLIERSYKERLIIAGALIAAELDRIVELEK